MPASMFNGFMKLVPYQQRLYRGLVTGLLTTSSLISQSWLAQPAKAEPAQTTAYCKFTKEAIAQKQKLLQQSLKGNSDAQKRYKTLLKRHSESLQQCRQQIWPKDQAIWLRLYPCDVRPGSVDEILDRIVNRGYNKVYVEVFSDGQVLLPSVDNSTPWPSVLRSPETAKVDLLAEVIQKGHERGLKVYSWLFTMNFGYNYAQRPDRQSALARNSKGESTLSFVDDGSQVFIDPYNQQAKNDYYRMVQEVIRRKPDGVLFDYIRYPRGSGSDSVVSKVQDLWIYGDAARQALYERSLNSKGLELIRRFISQGYISANDVTAVDQLYPKEGSPLWQGRNPPPNELQAPVAQRQNLLQWDLWQFSVAHAVQGVLDFLTVAMLPAQRQGIKTGAVFFPDANQAVGQQGYDSRLQAWERFPSSMEWHPMAYGVCGNTSCIEAQVLRVISRAAPGTSVEPVLAGNWDQPVNGRPSLEAQMQAIHRVAPQVNSISHFAYSWQEPQHDRDRKFCRL